ncbi:hypothetical protein R1sor_007118 [Riccia sorocarpa]|uniref:Uncharacterized protein n=1 Tax=Riccia sorocarpa TaxID=122646 RepID=A0ABD3HPI6_9MARC
MPEDIGIGGIDLNEDLIEMIPADDPETEDGGADDNVAAIAGLLAEVNVSGDDESAGEAAPHGRHTSVLLSLGWKGARIRAWVRSPTGGKERANRLLKSSDSQVPVGVGWEANSNICAHMYERTSAEVALRRI